MATLLLVDDDEAFRSMLRRTLQRVGHDVIEAAEGGARDSPAMASVTARVILANPPPHRLLGSSRVSTRTTRCRGMRSAQ